MFVIFRSFLSFLGGCLILPGYRSPHFCKVSLKYTSTGLTIERALRTCPQTGKIKNVEVGEIHDVQKEMKQLIIDSCIDDATKSATEVAKNVFEATIKKYEGEIQHIY